MKAEISIVGKKMESMIDGFMIMLPNIVLALIVFAIFFFLGRQIKRVVRRVNCRAFKLYIQGGRDTPQDFDFFLTYNLNAATA
ncbi:mechanosensitive ion channel family protein [Microcoleus sp.]|uniref:mechanosensitive ion channel family protein n=1 Tax=Microcoleus sp. TaxID=44472 RepID=UPI00403E6829